MDLPLSIEDICHDNEVYPLNLAVFIETYFMQAEEPCYESVRESKQVLVVVLHYFFEVFEFVVGTSLQHEPSIRRVIEKAA